MTMKKVRYGVAACATIVGILVFRCCTLPTEFRNTIRFDQANAFGRSWIVLTTINMPTRACQQLSELDGWNMVIIGDRKTPDNWSSELDKPNVVFLSLARQRELNYNIEPLLSEGSYGRKTIGYLYAIQHGAHYVYDTDDDTLPISYLKNINITSSVDEHSFLHLDTSNLTYNPMPHFGQATVWPRGYPLNRVAQATPRKFYLHENHYPTVKQGLIDMDPDVDAMIRLTRKFADAPMNIYFNPKSPAIMIPKGTFVPMNTQATITSYDALWGLVLPQSFSFRLIDIMRGYWQQAIIWEMGHQVSYYTSVTTHERNEHSLLKDAMGEQGFLIVEEVLQFLIKWKCDTNTVFGCIEDLNRKLVDEGLWKDEDIEFTTAWLNDLKAIGYVPPPFKRKEVSFGEKFEVQFYPDEQPTTLLHSSQTFIVEDLRRDIEHILPEASFKCKKPTEIKINSELLDTIIVIAIKKVENLPIFESWYRPFSRHIIYCKQDHLQLEGRISYVSIGSHHLSHVMCLRQVMRMRMEYSNYLYVEEDVLFNGGKLPLEPVELREHSHVWLDKPGLELSDGLISTARGHLMKCLEDIHFPEVLDAQSGHKATDVKSRFVRCMDSSVLNKLEDVTEVHKTGSILYIPEAVTQRFRQFADLLLLDDAYESRDASLMQFMLTFENPERLTLRTTSLDGGYSVYYEVEFRHILHDKSVTEQFCSLL